MKLSKWLRRSTIIILSILTCSVLVFLSSPLDAKTKAFNEMVDLDLIDQASPPKDINFNYLHQTSPPLEMAIMDNVRLADLKAAQLPENGLIGIPLGSVGPVSVSPDDPALRFTIENPGRFIAIGSENRRDGTASPLSVRDAREMFAVERRIGGFGGITQENLNTNEPIVADASGTFLEARRPIVHDIIIFDRHTHRAFVERDVFLSAICREAINAFLNDSYYYKRRVW